MPDCGMGYCMQVNEQKLRKHLLAKGLIEGSTKWYKVWHRIVWKYKR